MTFILPYKSKCVSDLHFLSSADMIHPLLESIVSLPLRQRYCIVLENTIGSIFEGLKRPKEANMESIEVKLMQDDIESKRYGERSE